MYYVTDNPIELLKQSLLSKFVLYYCLRITKNIAYHITEVLLFYADTCGDGQFQKFMCI